MEACLLDRRVIVGGVKHTLLGIDALQVSIHRVIDLGEVLVVHNDAAILCAPCDCALDLFAGIISLFFTALPDQFRLLQGK